METFNGREGWKGDDDAPKFGNRARRWFALRIRQVLEGYGGKGHIYKAVEIPALVDWFSGVPLPFVTYEIAEEFRGRGYSNGAWKIDTERVVEMLAVALDDVRGLAINSLDDWLRADMEDNITGSPDGGTGTLPKKLRRELAVAARVRRMKIPRLCVDCGAEFVKWKGRQSRCPLCVEKRKDAITPIQTGGRRRKA